MSSNVSGKAPRFIRRLYALVNDPLIDEITWTEDGSGFVVKDRDSFMRNALPLISKTKEYSAFVRLLNHYGFSKIVTIGPDSEVYQHKNFQRGMDADLVFVNKVKRKPVNVMDEVRSYKEEVMGMKQSIGCVIADNYRLSSEVIALKEQVSRQNKIINGLVEILSRIFKVGMQNHRTIRNNACLNSNIETLLKETNGNADQVELSSDDVDNDSNHARSRQGSTLILPVEKKAKREDDEDEVDFGDFF